jgi:hypothetical protein
MDHQLNSKEFMLQMATEKEELINEVLQTLWTLFERKRELIETANCALAAHSIEPDRS